MENTPAPPPQIVLPSDFTVLKPSNQPHARPAPIPDDDLVPTSAELKAMQATLRARTQAMTNAPLQVRAARDAELKAKRDRWPETRARIRFMDGTQLEKIFPSTNKIRSIYAFVRSCLMDDVKPIKFVLYEPPKRELKVSDLAVRDLTLAELHLAPSCLLLVRFEDEDLNHTTIPAPLSEFVLSQAIDPPVPQPPVQQPPPVRQAPPAASSSTSSTPKRPTDEKKIAKWLKLGSKK